MLFRHLLFMAGVLILTGCEKIAIMSAPKKEALESRTTLSAQADENFWKTLHSGNYAGIPLTTKLLTAAYLENPNDPKLAAHLGFTHIWKITERARVKPIEPTITNEIILAKKYFADAVQLAPNDARFLGFLGDSILIEGKIFHDKREEVRGYFTLKRAIGRWPEFNLFTAGYPMSILDPHTSQFKEGLKWQWETLTLCAGKTINQHNPDFSPYMAKETRLGPKRACWNSWIAPHNFEGFFLNMGDMLVKSGDTHTAVKIYNNAKLSKDYSSWPYRALLEKRIQDAQKNVAAFQHDMGSTPESTILFNSGYGCVVCHQAR
jgi:hypothetical protein